MSMHKIPLTELEEAGLLAHGLMKNGESLKPSQLADAFRHGIAWALKSTINSKQEHLNKEHEFDAYLNQYLVRNSDNGEVCAVKLPGSYGKSFMVTDLLIQFAVERNLPIHIVD